MPKALQKQLNSPSTSVIPLNAVHLRDEKPAEIRVSALGSSSKITPLCKRWGKRGCPLLRLRRLARHGGWSHLVKPPGVPVPETSIRSLLALAPTAPRCPRRCPALPLRSRVWSGRTRRWWPSGSSCSSRAPGPGAPGASPRSCSRTSATCGGSWRRCATSASSWTPRRTTCFSLSKATKRGE